MFIRTSQVWNKILEISSSLTNRTLGTQGLIETGEFQTVQEDSKFCFVCVFWGDMKLHLFSEMTLHVEILSSDLYSPVFDKDSYFIG